MCIRDRPSRPRHNNATARAYREYVEPAPWRCCVEGDWVACELCVGLVKKVVHLPPAGFASPESPAESTAEHAAEPAPAPTAEPTTEPPAPAPAPPVSTWEAHVDEGGQTYYFNGEDSTYGRMTYILESKCRTHAPDWLGRRPPLYYVVPAQTCEKLGEWEFREAVDHAAVDADIVALQKDRQACFDDVFLADDTKEAQLEALDAKIDALVQRKQIKWAAMHETMSQTLHVALSLIHI